MPLIKLGSSTALLCMILGCGSSSQDRDKSGSAPVTVTSSNAVANTAQAPAPNSSFSLLDCQGNGFNPYNIDQESFLNWVVNKDETMPVMGRLSMEGCLLLNQANDLSLGTIHVVFNSETLNSDNTLRDDRIIRFFFPEDITFTSSLIENISDPDSKTLPMEGESAVFRITGTLTVAGMESIVYLDVTVKNLLNSLHVVGTNIEFDMLNDLGLSQPLRQLAAISAPTTVDELLKINFDFNASR